MTQIDDPPRPFQPPPEWDEKAEENQQEPVPPS